ncbi:MAG: CCA tRNA nucleotidyltransferase [Planctomycetota bacterium]
MTNREAALRLIKKLRAEGFEALLAGGCVRDMLLGRAAKDYDIATSAHPSDVCRLFKRTLKVGAKFGVVMVMTGDIQTEVATFRTDSGYADGRRPDKIKFSNAREDAHRRDFTINGMFYDPVARKIIDYVGGEKDVKKGVIRTIRDPQKRFGEDYLRMLRAVRFSAQLGFSIEDSAWQAICDNAAKISRISGERIAMELEAIFATPRRADGAEKVILSGLGQAVFRGFEGEKARFGVSVLRHLRKQVDFALAISGFFAAFETKFALDWIEVLKLSRSRMRHIRFLLENRGILLEENMSTANLKLMLSEVYFEDLYELQRAIQRAKGAGITALVKIRKRARALADQELRPKRLLNGHDLIRLGAIPGPQVGQLAEELYIAQLEGNVCTEDQAKRWCTDWLEKRKDRQWFKP